MVTRGSIVCKLLASLMTRAGLSHIITVDLWQREIQGFFDVPIDNLRAMSFLIKYIQHSVSKPQLAYEWYDPTYQTNTKWLKSFLFWFSIKCASKNGKAWGGFFYSCKQLDLKIISCKKSPHQAFPFLLAHLLDSGFIFFIAKFS